MTNRRWFVITAAFVVVALVLWYLAGATDGALATVLRLVATAVIIGWVVFYLIDLRRDIQQARASRDETRSQERPGKKRRR